MLPFPLMIRFSEERYEFENGYFIKLPAELTDKISLRKYSKYDKSGWGTTDLGYSYYAAPLSTGAIAICPSIIVDGLNNKYKKFYGYNNVCYKNDIESSISSLQSIIRDQVAVSEGNTSLLIHDLRSISSSIQSSADEGIHLIDIGNIQDAKVRLDNITNTQQILKMRIDSLDLLESTYISPSDDLIGVYKKVDKVIRCFKPSASEQEKSIYLSGTSKGQIYGPAIFELIPYALIDNALKYAPPRTSVNVYVIDTSNGVRITVTSMGPKIRDAERKNIFDRGSRGLSAISSSIPGSGLGLYMIKRILSESFYGSISVSQHPETENVNGKSFYKTEFTVDVPI